MHECCRQKGFVYLAEADVARAADFLGMTAAALNRGTSTAPATACACECRTIPVPIPASRRLLHPCREADPMPHLSILAGTLESRREWKKTARWCPGIGKGPLIQIEIARAQAQEMREAYPALY